MVAGMKDTSTFARAAGIAGIMATVLLASCNETPQPTGDPTRPQATTAAAKKGEDSPGQLQAEDRQAKNPTGTPPETKDEQRVVDEGKPQPPAPTAKRIEVGKNVWFEKDGEQRRVLIQSLVCRRTGLLEQFMCRRMTKEHEAILSANCDARDIHKALLLTGAEPGSPVRFQPKFAPASGQTIKVFVEYQDKGKTKRMTAQEWVRNARTQKQMDLDWVFAGSMLRPDPFDPKAPQLYLANDGDVICLSNFETALLDLPISSTSDNDQLDFEAFTERIPPLETPVTIILEPVPTHSRK
jgi:hypothetical protein